MKRFLKALIIFFLLVPALEASQQLQQSTAIRIVLGPFIDDDDFVTLQTGLDVTTATVKIIKHDGTSATSFSPTASGGSNDMVEIASAMKYLELTTSNTDTVGRLDIIVTATDCLPVFKSFMVIPTSSWNAIVATGPSSIDDLNETDCSTIASTTSPMGKICANVDGKITINSPWRNPTTIATLASQTSFTLTAGSADNDTYKDWLILVVDQLTPLQMAKGVVSAYTGSTKTVTLRTDPAVFTMAIGDLVYLMPDPSLKPTVDGRPVVADAAGLVDANTVKVGPTGAGTAQTARDLGASVLLSSGTGTGQLDFTSGVVKSNVTQFGGSAGTFASGRPEVNTVNFASGLLDLSNGVETSLTVRQHFRAVMAILAGKASGFDTNTPTFRDFNDTKNRVISTTNSTGRTSVTFDLN
jgi:hypothetical protein